MGRGRKTETIQVSERIPRSSSGNSYVSAKNLNKSDLGGAIFGCKHSTMRECLAKELFGLPSSHFSYVRNIKPGLTLFLFNYSDRKMHGIYEAASPGEMNIDPYAWTVDGKERTGFPAQVRIRIRMQCQPLTENQFRKIVGDNYYRPQHFWFELDHAQTEGLIALFIASLSGDAMLPPIASSKDSLFTASRATKRKSISNSESVYSGAGEPKRDPVSYINLESVNEFPLNCDDKVIERGSSSRTLTTAPEEREFREAFADRDDQVEENVRASHSGVSPYQDRESQTLSEQQFGGEGLETEEEMGGALHMMKKLSIDPRCSNVRASHSGVSLHQDRESQTLSEPQFGGEEELETEEELGGALHMMKKLFVDPRCSTLQSEACGDDSAIPCVPRDMHEESRFPGKSCVLVREENTITSDQYHGNAELVQIVKELQERTAALERRQFESDREMQQLRNAVKDSGRKVQQLVGRVNVLESKLKCSVGLENVIYLIGGFNGTSWLPSLDSFSPSMDILMPHKSMSSGRSYASTASLNGNLYVIGGGEGNSCLNTVECYSQRNDEWTFCSSLIRAKGSLAGATLNGKIFAVGGENGSECLSDVEMFDPALGRWIYKKSMLQKRSTPAAAELHGMLYAVGGYDGQDYLQSVARLDPRVADWTSLPNMKTRRGYHSLAVLNEKLYVMGGYDGERLLSSVEIFDSRLGSWMIGEPSNLVRRCAAATVLGDSLFLIGGVDDRDDILDTVECYREGTGWVTCGYEAIGKRCYFSAIVP